MLKGFSNLRSVVLICCLLFFALTSCDSHLPQSDKDLYLSFYKDAMAAAFAIDTAYKPFGKAVENNKMVEATAIALEIKDNVRDLWSKLYAMKIPNLKDQEAYIQLQKGKDLLSSSYYHTHETLLNFIEYSKNPSVHAMAKIKLSSGTARDETMAAMFNLIGAGVKIGYTAKEISELTTSPIK